MKHLASLFALSLAASLLSGCGGGQSDFRPSLIGNWRVRSFSVDNGIPVNCPSTESAGNLMQGCTANSNFQFREDGTATDPQNNIRAYSRKGLFVTYYSPAPTTTELVFSGASDNVLTWTQPQTDVLPTVSIIMERQ